MTGKKRWVTWPTCSAAFLGDRGGAAAAVHGAGGLGLDLADAADHRVDELDGLLARRDISSAGRRLAAHRVVDRADDRIHMDDAVGDVADGGDRLLGGLLQHLHPLADADIATRAESLDREVLHLLRDNRETTA